MRPVYLNGTALRRPGTFLWPRLTGLFDFPFYLEPYPGEIKLSRYDLRAPAAHLTTCELATYVNMLGVEGVSQWVMQQPDYVPQVNLVQLVTGVVQGVDHSDGSAFGMPVPDGGLGLGSHRGPAGHSAHAAPSRRPRLMASLGVHISKDGKSEVPKNVRLCGGSGGPGAQDNDAESNRSIICCGNDFIYAGLASNSGSESVSAQESEGGNDSGGKEGGRSPALSGATKHLSKTILHKTEVQLSGRSSAPSPFVIVRNRQRRRSCWCGWEGRRWRPTS